MADTTTTNYALVKPEVGASEDTWGEKLNTNFDVIDAALAQATSTLSVVRQASGAIGGHRVVITTSTNTVTYADKSEPTHVGRVLGVTTNAADDGDDLLVVREGRVEHNGWSWTAFLPVYLSTNGTLTQTPPSTGFSQIVGFAETPTSLFVSLREPIILGD